VKQIQGKEEAAQLVLAAFEHYGVAKGEGLLAQNIVAFAWLRDRPTSEVKAGMKSANDNCWIVKSPEGFIVLTEEGSTALKQSTAMGQTADIDVGASHETGSGEAALAARINKITSTALKAGFSRRDVVRVLEAEIARLR
jgi:hypothetical protein